MKIVCPGCTTAYNLPEGAIPAQGRVVRCKKCGTSWHAMAEPPVARVDEHALDADWNRAMERAETQGVPDMRMAAGGEYAGFTAQDASGYAAASTGELGQAYGSSAASYGEADAGWDALAGAREASYSDAPPEEEAADVYATLGDQPAAPSQRIKIGAKVRRPQKPRGRQMGSPLFSATVAVVAGLLTLVILISVIVFRGPIVARQHNLASLYEKIGLPINLRGLAFSNVRTYRETDHDAPVLVVEGEIENVSSQRQPVPFIRFGLRSEMKKEVYAWTLDPQTSSLDIGERVRFKTKLPVPPQSAVEVLVQFADRGSKE